MELICYLHPGWTPFIRPAPATRPWMDDTPEAFAYRCLPLNIANAHGWEVLSPCGFDAVWTGETGVDAVTIRPEAGAAPPRAPVSLFGQGVLTFHIEGIFRTPAGWNLWIGGSPNRPKDGIAPLTGVVETDWSPFTFTMNWRFTRPDHWVHFDVMEPIGFLFPVQRAALEAFQPRLAPMESDPALMERFTAWSRARAAFHQKMSREPPRAAADKWQKHYYRGVDVAEKALIDDHRAKLRLRPFTADAGQTAPCPLDDEVRPPDAGPVSKAAFPQDRASLDLRKREWLLEAAERQRALSPAASAIQRRDGLSREEFLDCYYAPGRPVILTGEMAGWPALERWTPDYLARRVGSRLVEFQGGRLNNGRFEMEKDAHRREAPFDDVIAMISRPGAGNDVYITAYNSERNAGALSVLRDDLGALDKFLSPSAGSSDDMMWIRPAGTLTPLHHDLTNNLIAQVAGRKRLKIAPASQVGRLYNDADIFGEIADLDTPALDRDRFPKLDGVTVYDVVLEPGEIIYMPLGWWHQVRALDFSVTLTYTSFLWPNNAVESYPGA